VVYFDIGKQKVIWILKCKEQHKEAAGSSALTLLPNEPQKSPHFGSQIKIASPQRFLTTLLYLPPLPFYLFPQLQFLLSLSLFLRS
jgi:hypothetical protein